MGAAGELLFPQGVVRSLQLPVLLAPTFLAGRNPAARWEGAGLPSHWQHWARPGCPTGWHLAVLVLGFCCPEVQPV